MLYNKIKYDGIGVRLRNGLRAGLVALALAGCETVPGTARTAEYYGQGRAAEFNYCQTKYEDGLKWKRAFTKEGNIVLDMLNLWIYTGPSFRSQPGDSFNEEVDKCMGKISSEKAKKIN